MSRRRVITLSVSAAMAMAVAILAAPLNMAPARAEGGSQECNSRFSIIVLGRNCDRAEERDRAERDVPGPSGLPVPQPRSSAEKSRNLPVRLPAGSKQFTGWVSVEDGLLNLSHVQRITLTSADDKTFLVVAQLNESNEKVTLVTTNDREVAEKALRYLAANVKAISALRR